MSRIRYTDTQISGPRLSGLGTARPQFSGLETNLLLKQAPKAQQWLGRAVALRESSHGLSHLTFAQDTLVAWVPKTLVSRSGTEISEGTFLEFLESLLLYYSVPLLGGKLLQPLFHKVAGKQMPRQLLTTPLKELSPALQRQVLPAKAGIILATMGLVTFGGEYVIHYAKNLLTARLFKKERFSDVVNLSQSKPQAQPDQRAQGNGPVAQKAQRRIVQCLTGAAGILGGSLLLVRFGGRTRLARPLEALVKTFDFRFGPNGSYGLSRNQMLAFMTLAIPAYLDAARDKLERIEVGSRLLMILPYLAFGQSALEKLVLKRIGRQHPDLLQADGTVKPLDTLAQEAIHRAEQSLPAEVAAKNPHLRTATDPVIQAAAQELLPALRAKNLLFGVPLAVGVLGTGIGVGLVNRFWTAYRFHHQPQPTGANLTNQQQRFGAFLNQMQTRIQPQRQTRIQPQVQAAVQCANDLQGSPFQSRPFQASGFQAAGLPPTGF